MMPSQNLMASGTGVVLLCDQDGVIHHVPCDDLGLTAGLSLGETRLTELLTLADPKDIAALLAEVRLHRAAFDWELNVSLGEKIVPLHVAAGLVGDNVLFVGALSRQGISLRFYEEMMQINNEQMNALQLALKEKVLLAQALQDKDDEFRRLYDELSGMNNELVNLQRQLGKQNVELEAQKRALREYTENLKQMVAEKVRELEMERAKAIQMDKMASLGQMATGVAHELNQPLTAISFEADYLKSVARKARETGQPYSELLDSEELYELGENLMQDVARCRRITDHLRAFGRTSPAEPYPVDLNQPIEGSMILVGARLREHGIRVHLDLSPDLPHILADPHRLEQVFINLIANAEYAVLRRAEQAPSDYRKTLDISTRVEEDEVVAQVRDNGVGMSEEARQHLFEPFFTTKPEGEGTGLGLSISHGIVTDYGGSVTCESVVGEGTTFTLRFPVQ